MAGYITDVTSPKEPIPTDGMTKRRKNLLYLISVGFIEPTLTYREEGMILFLGVIGGWFNACCVRMGHME